ncbi:MAG: hypothetical protein ABIR54_00855 [Burkholderiaceae bacterium]
MTSLLQRCTVLTTKAEQLKAAQRHASQQREVQERTKEWKTQYQKLTVADSRAACLQLAEQAAGSVADKRSHLRHNAAQVLERLKSQEDIAELTSDAAWTRLLASVEGLAQELEAAAKAAWATHIESQGALEDPEWLENRAPSTPMNAAAISAYKTHYRSYASLAKLPMPRTADDVANLAVFIRECRAQVANVALDVPKDVQAFFEAIQLGTATLSTLTPNVLLWLRENGQLERYKVRSASQ